ncbi:hypothetical protein T10_3894 [Trichinella papuae]|uniref:Uncharacterized protein n=1 Tax=Trichinella papuae TaxID=268474 RepID=A0A0V1MI96_9BILA|nr:hypothetical protein T10_3894 [Trichinella papuae]
MLSLAAKLSDLWARKVHSFSSNKQILSFHATSNLSCEMFRSYWKYYLLIKAFFNKLPNERVGSTVTG